MAFLPSSGSRCLLDLHDATVHALGECLGFRSGYSPTGGEDSDDATFLVVLARSGDDRYVKGFHDAFQSVEG